jgi:hypothetical protein
LILRFPLFLREAFDPIADQNAQNCIQAFSPKRKRCAKSTCKPWVDLDCEPRFVSGLFGFHLCSLSVVHVVQFFFCAGLFLLAFGDELLDLFARDCRDTSWKHEISSRACYDSFAGGEIVDELLLRLRGQGVGSFALEETPDLSPSFGAVFWVSAVVL